MSVRQVARVEKWEPGVPVVVGWEHRSDNCGCMALEGMRLDKPGPRDLVGEPVVGFYPCDQPGHGARIEALRRSIVDDMPDPERALHDVLRERFEAATRAENGHPRTDT